MLNGNYIYLFNTGYIKSQYFPCNHCSSVLQVESINTELVYVTKIRNSPEIGLYGLIRRGRRRKIASVQGKISVTFIDSRLFCFLSNGHLALRRCYTRTSWPGAPSEELELLTRRFSTSASSQASLGDQNYLPQFLPFFFQVLFT